MSRKATQNLASIRALQIQQNRSNPLSGGGYDSDNMYDSDSDNGSLYGGNDGLMPLRMVGGGYAVGGGFSDILQNLLSSGMSFINSFFGKSTASNPKQPKSRKEELLEALGLPSNAKKRDVVQAYHQLARQHHPDKGGDMEEFKRYGNIKDELLGMEGEGRGKKLGKAHKLGKQLGHQIHKLHGGGFFDDFKKGFNSVVGPVAGVAKSLLPLAGPEGMAASGVIGALGYGRLGENGHGQQKRPRRLGENGHGQYQPFQQLKKGKGRLGENGHGQYQPFQELNKPKGSGIIRNVVGKVLGRNKGSGIIRNVVGRILGNGKMSKGDRRRMLVEEIMQKKGLSMTAASKYIRDHKLKY